MNPLENLQQLSEQILKNMPEPVRQMSEQAQQQMKEGLQAQLSHLNLVSRDEFDAQTALLAKAQARLAELEARLNELENGTGEG